VTTWLPISTTVIATDPATGRRYRGTVEGQAAVPGPSGYADLGYYVAIETSKAGTFRMRWFRLNQVRRTVSEASEN
jgi:hypothetical protein